MQRNFTGTTFAYVAKKAVLISQLITVKWGSAQKSKPNFSVNFSYCNSVSLVISFMNDSQEFI